MGHDVFLDVDMLALDGLDGAGDEVLDEQFLRAGFAEVKTAPSQESRSSRSPAAERVTRGKRIDGHALYGSPPPSPPSTPTPPAVLPLSPPPSPPASGSRSNVATHDSHKDVEGDDPPARSLPYAIVEAVFNERNLYVPCSVNLDPAQLIYDFDNADLWSALITNRLAAQGRPRAAHPPLRLPACPDAARLREVERQIRDELVSQLRRMREGLVTHKPRINRLGRLVEALEGGLGLFERQAASADDPSSEPGLEAEMDAWRRRVEAATPDGGIVRGRPAHYTYTDAKRIRQHVLSASKYAGLSRDVPIDFVVGVACFGFFGGAVSCWVFVGVVDDIAGIKRMQRPV